MNDKEHWEIKKLDKRADKIETKVEKIDEKVDDLLQFKATTTDKLINILQAIDEIKNNRRWWSRSFIMAIGGAAITSVFSMMNWVFQNFLAR